jgi:hypothetical protein
VVAWDVDFPPFAGFFAARKANAFDEIASVCGGGGFRVIRECNDLALLFVPGFPVALLAVGGAVERSLAGAAAFVGRLSATC